MRHGRLGIEPNRPFACGHGIVEAPRARERKGAARVDVAAVRRQPDRLPVRGHCILVAAEPRCRERIVRVRGRKLRIACDGIAERLERLVGPAEAGERAGAPRMGRRVPGVHPRRLAARLEGAPVAPVPVLDNAAHRQDLGIGDAVHRRRLRRRIPAALPSGGLGQSAARHACSR